MNLTALYIGKTCESWKKDQMYNITISKNSMMVYQAGTHTKKAYRNLSEFLTDFNLIVNHESNNKEGSNG